MVVKSEIKFIKNLQQKKYRMQNGLFVAEGVKLVTELLNSHIQADRVYATEDAFPDKLAEKCTLVSPAELKKMSGLQSPNKLLGIFHIPRQEPLDYTQWILATDAVQDPGNLGTIIRLCDWFGIPSLLCSPDTVDCFNPKVLQATMGSIARVRVVYSALRPLLEKAVVPVYGAFMWGTSVYSQQWPAAGILVVGNEAHGISKTLEACIPHKIGIPQYGKQTAESLNVAMATSILLNEIRRPIQR